MLFWSGVVLVYEKYFGERITIWFGCLSWLWETFEWMKSIWEYYLLFREWFVWVCVSVKYFGERIRIWFCLAEKHLWIWKAYGNTIYYLENGLSVCEKYFGERITIWFWFEIGIEFEIEIDWVNVKSIWGCLGVCVRNILVRGLQFGFGCLSWLG